ncbi:hypothetical protein BGZ70_009875 [Mortierella alpina]|uniref:Uncharacterized protein n=1 Tax=Mortierella alpina TaxID=64518 RepID=A0A9P6LZW0_MORAP|nr:hypothetical protein BGZ70_009875 [Mortierella alpina]
MSDTSSTDNDSTITQDDRAVGMEFGPRVLPPTGQDMGPTPHGPLRLPPEPPASQVHVLEAAPKGVRTRRHAAHLDEVGQSLYLPAMESHSPNPPEADERTTGGHPDNAILAVSDMVPNSTGDSSGTTGTDALRTQQRYKPTQEAFLAWVQDRSFDLDKHGHLLFYEYSRSSGRTVDFDGAGIAYRTGTFSSQEDQLIRQTIRDYVARHNMAEDAIKRWSENGNGRGRPEKNDLKALWVEIEVS